MTKKDAALHALGIAREMHASRAGDDESDGWIVRLLWLAEDLDRSISEHPAYVDLVTAEGDARPTKLRRLIEHPATPSAEREAAVAALAKWKAADTKLSSRLASTSQAARFVRPDAKEEA